METTSIHRQTQISQIPLEQLANNRSVSDEEKTAEVSRQFESILVKQILQEGQKSSVSSLFGKPTAADSIYQDMINNQLADGISKSGTLGLAGNLKSQLVRQAQGALSAPEVAGTGDKTITPQNS
jgi:Rod binding domain-containing protein